MIDLRHGDCLEIMKSIPDNSIDMVLTDPPYGTTACKWDSVIDFELMWEQLKRITKDSGAICLFGSEPFSSHLRLSNLKMFKYDWIWKKNGNSGDFAMAKNKPLSKHELISCFSGGKLGNGAKLRMEYNPQGLVKCNKKINKTDGGESSEHRPNRKVRNVTFTQEFTNYPNFCIEFNKDSKKIHPTQKPVLLLEYLIKTYTLESETVLDFTMGSGSTGVACKNLNRNFIGIEKDDKYFQIAKDRINEHTRH